ncbi:MAG: ABC transporter permease [Alphaproteobacteria bacterium]|nr:ABC transporter permease [Alphaproteobacteria bacterium]MDD9920639.1 ABC transporter permease [Alphaproteobacteria bacterium]
MTISITAIHALLTRYWLEYSQVWKLLLLRDVADRLIFLFAFGYGMGAIVRTMDGTSYFSFIVPGLMCSSPMMTMTLAMTFGIYERYKSTQIWQSWLATPVKLPEIMLSELIYANLRSLPAVFVMLAIALLLGELPNPWGIVPLLPIIILANMAYGAVAMCFTTHATRTMHFAFVQTFWMMPMYLFSGVFFDITQTPAWMQTVANIYPLTHILKISRPLLLGQPLDLQTLIVSVSILTLTFILAFTYALYRFNKKLRS